MRRWLYWLPPAGGIVTLGAGIFDFKPAAIAVVLGVFLAYAGLHRFWRAPDWLTRLVLGLLVFSFCFVVIYQGVSLTLSPAVAVMPTEALFLAFIISAPVTSLWRFAFLRRPMRTRDAQFVAFAAIPLTLAAGLSAIL